MDPALFQNLHFRRCRIFGTTDNCPRMTHPPAGRRRTACNKSNHRLVAEILYPAGCLSLHPSADLADHYDSLSFRIIHQQFDGLLCCSSYYRVPSYSYTG